jgi:hypothetical protein
MTQMQATAAESPALDAGRPNLPESNGGRSSTLPTQVISFAIGDDQYGVGFLSGLVTTDSGMIAVIDLANLLSLQIDDEAVMRPAMSA